MTIEWMLSLVAFLCLCGTSGTIDPNKCTDDATVKFVPYCELVRNPAKYDGRVIKTEAVWQQMVHAAALADNSCPATEDEALLTLPSFAQRSNFNSSVRRQLWKLLQKGGVARVRVMGTFHGRMSRPYATDGQIFQLEISCLLSVSRLG